ncbi:MAG: phage head closure protein [Tannerellaceae bacterium]|nr:phage head closure protein [Tannerellaceae bacterium]MCC8198546.1 phage head closure protein [Tannerellaceae bacterium]
MRAGHLNRIIRIENRKERKNKFGEAELHWEPFLEAHAQVEEETGSRLVEHGEQLVSYTKTFVVRSYPGCVIHEYMRIIFDKRTYRINSILRERDRTVIHTTYWNR